MNKYVRTAFCLPFGAVKMVFTKIFHFSKFSGSVISVISPFTEITMDNGAELRIGKKFKMRDGAKIRVRKGAVCIIGNNVSVNSNNIITCRDKIEIGDNIQFSPNVFIYDHDHDFRADGGIMANKFKTSPIKIGNNVWVGTNVTILRGASIGDNSVIGAGCVVRGVVPPNSILVQHREDKIMSII